MFQLTRSRAAIDLSQFSISRRLARTDGRMAVSNGHKIAIERHRTPQCEI